MKRLLFLSLGIFIATQTVSTQLTARPFIIGVVGKIGAGKTTFANLLSRLLPNCAVLNADKNFPTWKFTTPMIGSIDENVAKTITPKTSYLIIEGATVGIDEETQYESSDLIDFLIHINTADETCFQRMLQQKNHTYAPDFIKIWQKNINSINHNIDELCSFHADLTIEGNGEIFNRNSIYHRPALQLLGIITKSSFKKSRKSS